MALRFGLSNGLTVLFEEQHAAHVAAFQVWVKAGSADERPDQAGLAHLHEHMLFKGTRTRKPGEIASAIESRGGEINAWTSFDQTVYHAVLASRFAREGLEILSDMIRGSVFDEGELAREIEVVCEEIKRSHDAPTRRASRALFSTAYQVHPYRRPVIGWEETVRSFDRARVLEFYERHYTPENLVLAVAGDLSLDEVQRFAEESFGGGWGRPVEPPPVRAREPVPDGLRLGLKPDEAKEVHLELAFPIPAVSHPDLPALDLLALIAGQGQASRLLLEVKRRRSLVNGISAYAYTPKDPGLWAAAMTLPPSKLAEALEATARVLWALRASPVAEDELHRAKAMLESDAVYERETVQGLARKLGFFETTAGGIEEEARYYEQIAKVSAEGLREVAERYLDFERCFLTGLLPEGTALSPEQAKELLERARRGPVPPRPPAVERPPEPVRVLAKAAAKAASGIVDEVLPSGARIVIREEGAVPLFSMRAVFLGGLRYENESNNGLGVLLARMLARGTASLTEEEIARRIDGFAGSLRGFSGRNSIGLRGELLSRHFEPAFELFSEVLRRPAIPDWILDREREVLLQDILTREDKPASVAFDLFARTLYQHHPYRLSVVGEAGAVQALTAGTLRKTHARWCDPSRMVLAVVGDVKADRVLARAQEAFGEAVNRDFSPPTVSPEPFPEGPREVRRTLARAQSHLVLGFRGASLADEWGYALEVLSTILSGQGGRLFVQLRDKQSLAYSVSCMNVEGLEPGYFAVYMGTSPEKVPQALEGIRAELSRIRDEKVGEDELARAKAHLIGTNEIRLQRNGARAGVLALDTLYGLGPSHFLSVADRLAAVSAEDVLDAAQRVIDFNRSVLAVVGP